MRIKTNCFLLLVFLISVNLLKAQSPGLIVRPAGGAGVTILNPNGDAYCSSTPQGFINNDVLESELPFQAVPPAIIEPIGDIATGPLGGFSDIVNLNNGNGFYIYKDAVNMYFRFRMGGIVSGSKGYSILLDTDGKIGGTAPYADPNYIAPSGTSYGNPGFEYEVSLQTNFQVAVYNVDGTVSPGAPATYSLNTNSQVSVALTTNSNNADYFYDWFVPLSAIGNPASVRIAATTTTSPNSIFQGRRSDIYGINDAANASPAAAWETVINSQPPVNLGTFTGVSAVCTAVPVINGPILTGSSVAVTGTWSRLDASKPGTATITLYKNGVTTGTTTVNSGNTWSITVSSIADGDQFYAMAQATGESQCLQSITVKAKGCLTLPTSPVLTCASLKGISGTMPTTANGNSIVVYELLSTTASPLSNPVSTVSNLTYPVPTNFAYYTNGCSGGTNFVNTGIFMIVTQNGSCKSLPVFVCVNSGSSGTPPALTTNAISITQPIYASTTTINGTGAISGNILRLFINGQYISSISATGSSFSFSGLSLQTGDQLKIYAQTPGSCITQSNTFTVNCFAEPAVITTTATGNLLSGATSISGTSAYAGASVQLYKGTAPAGVAAGPAVTVSASGTWTATVPVLVSGETYYAVQTVSGCASSASSAATVLSPSACPSISGSYTDASTTVNGTMPSAFTGTIRLYLDGNLIGSQAISSATVWSIPAPANTLYYNGILTVTAQATGNAESSGCGSVTIGCTSPSTPLISPASISINPNQSVTYSVSNVTAGSWFSLTDNTGTSFATSIYKNNTTSFDLTSSNFSMPGTYNLKLSADVLTGCPASFSAASVIVNITLPLTLLNFSGLYENGRLQFDWSTTNEVNVDHFELEKSNDGRSFFRVADISLQNNSNTIHNYSYGYFDQLQQDMYFRLRIIDIDGKTEYSRTVLLSPGDMKVEFTAIPNPFHGTLNISYRAKQNSILQCRLFGLSGKVVSQAQRSVSRGINMIGLQEFDNLAPGIYLLEAIDRDSNQKTIIKIVKN